MGKKARRIKDYISDLKEFVKKVSQYEKQYKDDGIENPDAEELYHKLFRTVRWLVDNDAFEQMKNSCNKMDDDEIYIIEDIINDIVYRFEYPVEDNEGNIYSLIVTPFAIPITIVAPIVYAERIASLENLPKTIEDVRSSKLIRNCLNLGAEPITLVDGRLWKNDEVGWEDFGLVRRYLKGIVANISNLSPTVPSLKIRNISRSNRHVEKRDVSTYVITRTLVGTVISENVDIENKLFGCDDNENSDDNEKEIAINSFMKEFSILCENELKSMDIEDVTVRPLSPWPIELFEVPDTVVRFSNMLDFSQRVSLAARETQYSGGDRTLNIIPDDINRVTIMNLLVYDNNSNKPFFTYTWNIANGLENPESIVDNIVTLCTKELKVNKILIG